MAQGCGAIRERHFLGSSTNVVRAASSTASFVKRMGTYCVRFHASSMFA
jgi:hypothetical protein